LRPEDFKARIDRLQHLLATPSPGLFTWSEAVHVQMSELTVLWLGSLLTEANLAQLHLNNKGPLEDWLLESMDLKNNLISLEITKSRLA
jgi:hypothetical protein